MFTGKLCLLVSVCAWAQQQPLKDAEEYRLYNVVAADFAAKNYVKAIADLEVWKRAYPESSYKLQRQCLYVQAYDESNQPGEALHTAAALMADSAKLDSENVLRVLFTSATAIKRVAKPSASELAFAESGRSRQESARRLPGERPRRMVFRISRALHSERRSESCLVRDL